MTILFDGIDLSGKTTVARAVAARLGGVYNSGGVADGLWARLGRRVFAGSAPNVVKGAVYTGSFIIDALRSRTVGGRAFVQDRYWPSLMAYARASYPPPAAAVIVWPSRWYLRFDVNIHVTCTPAERRRRFEARGPGDRIDRCLLRDPAFADRYETELTAIMRAQPNYLRLDTADRTVEESVELAIAHIEASQRA